jgi:cytoskeleton protein RodZ
VTVEFNDDAESPAASGLAAVGNRLSAARREQQREVAAVATALHLRSEVVEALERGDESGLPALTFVRGYIKAYARLLGLDEQEVLAALPVDDSYRAQPLKAVGMRRKRTLRLPLGKGFFWLALIALVLALVTYGVPLVERLMDKVDQPEEGGSSLVLPLDAPTSDSAAEQLPAFSGRTETGELPESKPSEGVNEEPTEESVQEPVSSGIGVTASEPLPAPETSVTGPAEINMRFSEDSWVEMESHGRKLVVGTQRAGSQRTVRAEPPIQILLGNAPGVEIVYRGEVVDLQSFQRGKVARLVLDD